MEEDSNSMVVPCAVGEVVAPEGNIYEVLNTKKEQVLQRQKENREKRIEIARRLESMKTSFVDRERQMQELEKEMFLLKKRDIVEELVRSKVKEAEASSRLEELNRARQVHLAKRQEIVTFLQERQKEERLAAEKQLAREAAGGAAGSNEEGEEGGKKAAVVNASGRVVQSPAERAAQERILREMLEKLRENHSELQSDILRGRKQLTEERFELEARLNQVRRDLMKLNQELKEVAAVQAQAQTQMQARTQGPVADNNSGASVQKEADKGAHGDQVNRGSPTMTSDESRWRALCDTDGSAAIVVDAIVRDIKAETKHASFHIMSKGRSEDEDSQTPDSEDAAKEGAPPAFQVPYITVDESSMCNLEQIPISEEDETLELTHARAQLIQLKFEDKLKDLNRRISIIHNETNWLLELPDNKLWEAMSYRVKMSLDASSGYERSNIDMAHFLDYIKKLEEMQLEEVNESQMMRITYEISREFLVEAADAMIHSMSESFVSLITRTEKQLENTFINVILDIGSTHSRAVLDAEDMKGKRDVYQGCIDDLRNEMSVRNSEMRELMQVEAASAAEEGATVELLNDEYDDPSKLKRVVHSVHTTQPIANGQYVRAKPRPARHQCVVDKVLSVIDDVVLRPDDNISRQTLKEVEKHHWSGVSLEPILGGALLTTMISGVVSFIKVFPRPLQRLSLLIMGTKLGQFLIWSIPWVANDLEEPVLIGVTPKFPSKERCEVVDIKESACGGMQFVCIDSLHNIRVWSFNALPLPPAKGFLKRLVSGLTGGDSAQAAADAPEAKKKPKHSGTLFPRAFKDFAPVIPTCIFYLTPVELNIPPVPSLFGSKKKKPLSVLEKVKHDTTPQPHVIPNCVTFHPSLTVTHRNPSIMVGTKGGDCYKINMDFKDSSMDTPILYCPPFVDVEYIHPTNASSENTVLQLGAQERRGNKVFRELFHFHKSKVVMLEVVNKLSDVMVSMDEDGVLALWKYSSKSFVGKGWFEPISSAKLDLGWQLAIPPLEGEGSVAVGVGNTLYDSRVRLNENQIDGLVGHFGKLSSNQNSSFVSAVSSAEATPSEFQLKQLKAWKSSQLRSNVRSYIYYPIRHFKVVTTVVGATDAEAEARKKPDEDEDEIESTRKRAVALKNKKAARTTTTIIYDDELLVLFEKIVVDVEYDVEVTLPAEEACSTADDGKESDGVKADAPKKKIERRVKQEVFWRSGKVVYTKASSTTVATAMTNDGSEIIFLISSAGICTSTAHSTRLAGVDSTMLHLVSLRVNDLAFQSPVASFMLDEACKEHVVSLQVGPMLKETLTRSAFVLTSTRMRVFSMGTGQELFSAPSPSAPSATVSANKKRRGTPVSCGLPLSADSITAAYPSFGYHFFALCPLQHMCAFASPFDERIVVYILRHSDDGQRSEAELKKGESHILPAAEAAGETEESSSKKYHKLFSQMMDEYKEWVQSQEAKEDSGCRTQDGGLSLEKRKLLSSCFNQPVEALYKVAVQSVQDAEHVHLRGDPVVPPGIALAAAKLLRHAICGEILEESVLDVVMSRIGDIELNKQRATYIAEVYSSDRNDLKKGQPPPPMGTTAAGATTGDTSGDISSIPLGFIEPTHWPPKLPELGNSK